MTASLNFRITPDRQNRVTRKYASELKARMQAVRKLLVNEAATSLLNTIQEKLPADPLFDDLRKALVVRGVEGLDENEAAAAVITKSDIAKRKLRDLPQDRVLLIVQKPNRRIQPPPEEIFILRAHNPWTMDTIPFIPKADVARLVFRIVAKEEVDRTRDLRRKALPSVLPMLAKRGFRFTDEDRKRMMAESAGTEAAGDLVFASLRAEFGLKGYKSAPHWRPGIREVKGTGFAMKFFSRRDVEQALSDPDFSGWDALGEARQTIGTERAESLQKFQDKVKVR